jgi:hypothetical protein
MQVAAIGPQGIGDLHGELAGRRQDQAARRFRTRLGLVLEQALQDRQAEGRRLAGAGLGDAQQITPGEEMGDRLSPIGVGVSFLGGQRALDRLDEGESENEWSR